MENEEVGVVVDGLLTPFTTILKLVPPTTTVLISTVSIDALLMTQFDDIPVRLQVEVPGASVIWGGKLMMMNDVEISLLIFLNHTVYLLTAFMLVLVALTPDSTMVEGLATMSNVPLSIR